MGRSLGRAETVGLLWLGFAADPFGEGVLGGILDTGRRREFWLYIGSAAGVWCGDVSWVGALESADGFAGVGERGSWWKENSFRRVSRVCRDVGSAGGRNFLSAGGVLARWGERIFVRL